MSSDLPLLTAPFLHYIPTSPPSQELDFHLPSRTPLHGISVSEWAGTKSTRHVYPNLNNLYNNNHSINTTAATITTVNITTNNKPIVLKEASEDNWKDVYRNIKCMDQLYDASFYSWLKSEENVLVTAMYLHRIANEYPLVRIINALKWLISDWRLESISTLIRHVTVDWCDEAGDLRRAHLLRHLTSSWATQYTTTLITMVLSSAPYTNTTDTQRERFLRAFTKEWDFSKLSEFFMYLQSPANIDYKVKCVMLQEAARRERETLGAKLRKKRIIPEQDTVITPVVASVDPTTEEASSTTTTTGRRHHRRTSSNDVNDIKRLRLSTPDLVDDTTDTSSSSTTVATNTTNTIVRRSVSPDQHHHHHHPLRCVTTNSSSSSSTSASTSTSNDVCGSSSSSTSNYLIGESSNNTRRRTSSNASMESNDDPMDTDSSTITRKKTSYTHFTSSDETI